VQGSVSVIVLLVDVAPLCDCKVQSFRFIEKRNVVKNCITVFCGLMDTSPVAFKDSVNVDEIMKN